MRAGDTVTWRARHFGIPWRMTSRISEYEHPTRFVDEQVSGPFRFWWHEHRFEPTSTGTVMIDVVNFSSPMGLAGRLVDRLILVQYMTELLTARNRWLVTALERSSAG